MNIATHSVSQYEQELQANEWRIVMLFRTIHPHNIQQAKNYFFVNQN